MFDQLTNIQLFCAIAYAICLIVVIKSLPQQQLLNDRKVQHLVFGCAASVFVLWMFRTGIPEAPEVHFLWLTALVLVLGLRWAMISSALALFGVTIAGEESWQMLGVNGLLGVTLPIVISYAVYIVSFHKLPRNFFVYIFVCAFLPAGAMMAMKMFLIGGYYYFDGFYDWHNIQDSYLALIPLMIFPEAMFNGMTMTLLVIHFPSWVYTFYDKHYLHGK